MYIIFVILGAMRIHIEEYFKIKNYAKQVFEHSKSAWYWDTLVCKWLNFQTIAPISGKLNVFKCSI